MKKILLLVSLFSLVVCFASAQCIIDTTNTDLLTPPSDELPCIERTLPYSTVLQLFTPPSIGGANVDSIRITSFSGLPSGITTECNPVTCTMAGFGRACITLSGTTSVAVGVYDIEYEGFAYTSFGTAPFDYIRANYPGVLPEYSLFVIAPGGFCQNTANTGIYSNNQDLGAAFTVYPNPNNGQFELRLNVPATTNGQIIVSDVTGRAVFLQKTLPVSFQQTTINLQDLAKGIYLVQYRTAEGTASKKISVE